jgi:Flp pilus assembly pilin Flp
VPPGESTAYPFDKLHVCLHHEFAPHFPRLEAAMSAIRLFRRIFVEETGQDIAEYAVMLAVILVLVVGTIRLIGSNANNAFSSVASSIQ